MGIIHIFSDMNDTLKNIFVSSQMGSGNEKEQQEVGGRRRQLFLKSHRGQQLLPTTLCLLLGAFLSSAFTLTEL